MMEVVSTSSIGTPFSEGGTNTGHTGSAVYEGRPTSLSRRRGRARNLQHKGEPEIEDGDHLHSQQDESDDDFLHKIEKMMQHQRSSPQGSYSSIVKQKKKTKKKKKEKKRRKKSERRKRTIRKNTSLDPTDSDDDEDFSNGDEIMQFRSRTAKTYGETTKEGGRKPQKYGQQSRQSRQRRQLNHPWGPESQQQPEIETLAGDTATLTRTMTTASNANANRQPRFFGRKQQQQRETPNANRNKRKTKSTTNNCITSMFKNLDKEEVKEDFGSAKIRHGIEHIRKGTFHKWTTPYEIDAPRTMPPKSSSTSRSPRPPQTHVSLRQRDGDVEIDNDDNNTYDSRADVGREIWNGIEILLADAYSDAGDADAGEEKSHMSVLADVLPENILQAMKNKSYYYDVDDEFEGDDNRFVYRRTISDHIGDESHRKRLQSGSFKSPSENTASADLSSAFIDSNMTVYSEGSITRHRRKAAMSSRKSIEGSESSGNSASKGTTDDIKIAQNALSSFESMLLHGKKNGVATADVSVNDNASHPEIPLNNFMDNLLEEFEARTLKEDTGNTPTPDEESTPSGIKKQYSSATLFDVFRWSLKPNEDETEKQKYVTELNVTLQQQQPPLQQRERSPSISGSSSSTALQSIKEEEEYVEEDDGGDLNVTTETPIAKMPKQDPQPEKSSETPVMIVANGTSPESGITQRGSFETGEIPSWAAIGGVPIVMSAADVSKLSPSTASSGPADVIHRRISKGAPPVHVHPVRAASKSSSSGSSSSILPSSFINGDKSFSDVSEGELLGRFIRSTKDDFDVQYDSLGFHEAETSMESPKYKGISRSNTGGSPFDMDSIDVDLISVSSLPSKSPSSVTCSSSEFLSEHARKKIKDESNYQSNKCEHHPLKNMPKDTPGDNLASVGKSKKQSQGPASPESSAYKEEIRKTTPQYSPNQEKRNIKSLLEKHIKSVPDQTKHIGEVKSTPRDNKHSSSKIDPESPLAASKKDRSILDLGEEKFDDSSQREGMTSQSDVISVGDAGDIHVTSSSDASGNSHVQLIISTPPSKTDDESDQITLDSHLQKDYVRNDEQVQDVPETNKAWQKSGGRYSSKGPGIRKTLNIIRKRGKCPSMRRCRRMRKQNYEPFIRDDRSKSSRKCLMHEADDRFELGDLKEVTYGAP